MSLNNSFFAEAIRALRPDTQWFSSESTVTFLDGTIPPNEAEIQAKIAELQAAEPMRQLRIQRNQLLQQTDWRMTTDYPYNDQPAWATYRTELRNLPETANPTLDENGNLIVDWPTAPSEV